jgi:hypothetical protein
LHQRIALVLLARLWCLLALHFHEPPDLICRHCPHVYTPPEETP